MHNRSMDHPARLGIEFGQIRTITALRLGSKGFAAVLALATIAVINPASAGCNCNSAAQWDPYAFLNAAFGDTTSSAEDASLAEDRCRAESYARGDLLADIPTISGIELIIDPSGSVSSENIAGTISLPARGLLDIEGNLKETSEIAAILGNAGISPDRSVVVVGDDLLEGEPTLLLWIFTYMGQEDVRLLDGDTSALKAAGLTQVQAGANEKAEYSPLIQSGLLIEGGCPEGVSIADLREFQVYAQDRLSGAIHLDVADLVEGGKIADEEDLENMFVRFSPVKPVVVCSEDYPSASLAWYAFELMGFDSSIYIRRGAVAPEKTSGFTRLGTT